MRQQRFDVAQDFPHLVGLRRSQPGAAQQVGQGTLGVHQTQADLAVDVFLASQFVDGAFHAGVVAFQHLGAHRVERGLHFFQNVGEFFHLGFKQDDHQRQGVFRQPLLAAGAQPEHADGRQLIVVQGEQPLILEGEGDRGVADALVLAVEKIRMQVQAVGVLEKAGAGLDFLHIFRLGQVLPVQRFDLFTLLVVGLEQVDPDGLVQGGRIRFEIELFETVIAQGESVDHVL